MSGHIAGSSSQPSAIQRAVGALQIQQKRDLGPPKRYALTAPVCSRPVRCVGGSCAVSCLKIPFRCICSADDDDCCCYPELTNIWEDGVTAGNQEGNHVKCAHFFFVCIMPLLNHMHLSAYALLISTLQLLYQRLKLGELTRSDFLDRPYFQCLD